jgi:hypothetical protein
MTGLALLGLALDIGVLPALWAFFDFPGDALIGAQAAAVPLTFWLLYLSYRAFDVATERDAAPDERDAATSAFHRMSNRSERGTNRARRVTSSSDMRS